MASPSGNLLAGRYRTIKRLGSGGMAVVLLAEDERLGRQVAVKRMHAESPEDVAKRFKREAQLGAALNHPNIVSIFDIETDDENVLIVMEYVSGGTLKDALARGPLPFQTALKVLRGIAAAVDYAHEHGIVHRDIKPANVLLDADGRAKLADLGIATAAEVTSITKTGSVLGTAAYMPPERLDGHPGGAEADIYAFATVAYEALTGHKARQGRSAVEIAAMVMSEPPPDLRVHLPEAPEEAAHVLARGMARDPAERPARAGDLVRELCQAFEDVEEPTAAEPTTPLPPAAATVGADTDGTPAAIRPPPTYTRQRSAPAARRWLLPVAGLVVALLAVAAILALAGGNDSSKSGGESGKGAADSSDAQGTSTEGSSASGSDAEEGGGSSSAGASPDGSGTADAPPAQVVQDFYTLSADDKFEQAWELAGPGLRAQLNGYNGYVATLTRLESIEFPTLKTTLESSDRATVEIATVATKTNGTDRCSGTVDMAGGDGNWKIERLNVDCNTGSSGGAPPSQTPGKGPAGGKPQKEKKQK